MSAMFPIREFKIFGLFGGKDVKLVFNGPVMILIADNGSGKTTILNAIHAVLSKNLYKLLLIDFKRIEILFSNGNFISFSRNDLESEVDLDRRNPMVQRFLKRVPSLIRKNLQLRAENQDFETFSRNPLLRELYKYGPFSPRAVWSILNSRTRSNQLTLTDEEDKIERIQDVIVNSFSYEILFYPTYRRIEERLGNLGYEKSDDFIDDALTIRFGMEDVQNQIDNITTEIKNSSIEWYSRISGQMLKQLIDGVNVGQRDIDKIRNGNALGIVLDRIGSNINNDYRNQIKNLVKQSEISEPKYQPLVYLLSNLVDVYHKQKALDEHIKDFVNVCNRYLSDKKIQYNESKVEINIIKPDSKNSINIENLSSGEKQIVSLFSRIYLSGGDGFAVFFDEPELSLSIDWQRTLLPDIINSKRCKFLFATTHSPFIFDNELSKYVYDLNTFIG